MKPYPNPFSDHISFEPGLENNANLCIELFNLFGIKIATVFSGNVEAGFYHIDYEPHNFIDGLLIYQMSLDGKGVNMGKVIYRK
jgi:hypothetical protein